MDNVAIVTLIGCAVLGAIVGWGLAPRFDRFVLKALVIVVATVAGAAAGWQWALPWVEEEWFFRASPSPETQVLVAVDPANVGVLKQRMRGAYAETRSLSALTTEGVKWLEEHADRNNFLVLLRVADNTMPVRTYEQLYPLVKIAYEADPIACYQWLSGTGHPTPQKLGFSTEQAELARFLGDRTRAVVIAHLPAASPLDAIGPGPQALVKQLRARWDAKRFDLDALDRPQTDLPDDRKANGCYTMNAILSEIQTFEQQYRRYMINVAFTPKLNPDFAAPR